MRVKFTPSARARFLECLQRIRQDDPKAARRFRERSEPALRRLETFPESGRSVPEFPALPHREVIVRPYRLFYRVVGRTIWVVAVWHEAHRQEGATR